MGIEEAINTLERMANTQEILMQADRYSPAARAAGERHRKRAEAVRTLVAEVRLHMDDGK